MVECCNAPRPMLQTPSMFLLVAVCCLKLLHHHACVIFYFHLGIPSSCMLPCAFASIMFMRACSLVMFVLFYFASCIFSIPLLCLFNLVAHVHCNFFSSLDPSINPMLTSNLVSPKFQIPMPLPSFPFLYLFELQIELLK